MDFRQDFKKKIHAENLKKIYSKINVDDLIKISPAAQKSKKNLRLKSIKH